MKNEICLFNGNQVSFALDKENEMMVNATEMAKIFGRQINHFMDSDGTKNFIEACLYSRENGNIGGEKNENSNFLRIEKEDDLYTSRQKSGTWMHRILALKFAAWLDPYFEVWVYSTIETLLFGRHVKREQSFERTISLQKELDELQDKPKKTGEDFERYLSIQRELKREIAVRKSLTVEELHGMKSLF
jgi:hypothetical protein